jgi:hypothetical protein
MDKSNDESLTPIKSRENINNSISREKLSLPKIKKELVPLQLSKMNSYKRDKNQRTKFDFETFLTSRKLDKYLYNSNNEDKMIYKLLKEKIDVSNNRNDYINQNKSSKRLKTEINEETLNQNTIFRRREAKELKEVKVHKLLTNSRTYKNRNKIKPLYLNDDNIVKNNGNSIYKKLYKELNDSNKSKRFKTLEKKSEKDDDSIEYYPNNKKKINCALKYRYDKNKKSINVVNALLQNINNRIKATFDGFKNETDDLFNDMLNNKEKLTF